MITTANFRKFRTSEFIQFFSDIKTLCEQNEPHKLNLHKQFNEFCNAQSKLEENFGQKHKSEFTKKLSELDDRRDNAVICLSKITDGYLNHFDKQKKEDAKRISDCMGKYGNRIYSLNYQAETSVLTSLGNDLTNGLSEAVHRLNLTEVVYEMIDANSQFNAIYLDRIEEMATDDYNSSGELIREALKKYRTFCKHLQAHATISSTESYLHLIDQLNSLTERYNFTVAQRNGHTYNENPDEDENR